MPIYEYKCKCGYVTEAVVPVGTKSCECDRCGREATQKLMSVFCKPETLYHMPRYSHATKSYYSSDSDLLRQAEAKGLRPVQDMKREMDIFRSTATNDQAIDRKIEQERKKLIAGGMEPQLAADTAYSKYEDQSSRLRGIKEKTSAAIEQVYIDNPDLAHAVHSETD